MSCCSCSRVSCCVVRFCVFFFKQKTAYEMRISDWSSDVCSSDLAPPLSRTLEAALAALRASACYRDGLGDRFVDYFLHIKDAEIARYQLEVSEDRKSVV